jgi:hypothetical protein
MHKRYELIEGKADKKFKTVTECKKMHAAFSPLISSIAKCLQKNSLQKGEFKFRRQEEELSLNFFNDNSAAGEILVEIGGAEDENKGIPFYASWDGIFYRLPNHKKKPFVVDGQLVKKGDPMGVVFVNKNEQFILNSPGEGVIFFAAKDLAVPIQAFDETNINGNRPLFFLM